MEAFDSGGWPRQSSFVDHKAEIMGRGDSRTRKGKIFRSSYGLTRKKKKASAKKGPSATASKKKKS